MDKAVEEESMNSKNQIGDTSQQYNFTYFKIKPLPPQLVVKA